MAQIIPNEETWIGFLPGTLTHKFGVANVSAPKAAEISAAIDVTDFVIQLNASTTGNTVPVPRLKRLFEPSIDGTSTGAFSGDFYRDDEDDAAYAALPRRTKGCFFIKRFGGTGTDLAPAVGEDVEVWPVSVTSRAPNNLASGTAQMFTLTCSVPEEPDEEAVVVA